MRETHDRGKPHCFELYACGGADIIKACKTDSEGKVNEEYSQFIECIALTRNSFSIAGC